MNDQLTKCIDEIVSEKSLSMEVLKKVYELKEAHTLLQKNHEEVYQNLNDANKGWSDARTRIVNLETQVSKYENVLERERKIELAEALLKVRQEQAQSERNLAVELFKTVFANTTVRKTVNSSVPVGVPSSGYVSNYNGSHSETVEEG